MQSKRLTALFVTGYPPACGGGGIPLAIYSQLALMAGVAHHRRDRPSVAIEINWHAARWSALNERI